MSTVEKWVGGLTMIALATTVLLPGRQTVPVINAITGLFRGAYGTVMGTAKAT